MKKHSSFLFAVLVCCINVVPLMAQTKKVEAVAITVSDMDRSIHFYADVLRFKIVSDHEMQGSEWENLYGVFGARMRIVRMQLGEELIELIDYLTPGGRSIPEAVSSNDLSFQHIAIVVSDMDSAYRWLRRNGVQHVSTGPQTLPATIPEAAGIKAFYFQDPDRHNLEVIFFPKDKGQPKWQQAANEIFLGIDHTAIAVSNTNGSHQFYANTLGIERKGDSWNKGVEQEHLNNVQGAWLHITGYRSQNGPGVEFLEYLRPLTGKKYPADTRSDDLWNWYTVLVVDDATSLFTKLTAAHRPVISKKPVTIQSAGTPAYKAFLVRDPDGHAVMVKQIL